MNEFLLHIKECVYSYLQTTYHQQVCAVKSIYGI